MANDLDTRLEAQSALLDEWVDTRRKIAALEARSAGLLSQRLELMDADVADAPMHREVIWRSMIAQYSAAGRVAKGSAEHAFTDARRLTDSFPALQDAFAAGDVSAGHVREILLASTTVTQAITAGSIHPDALGFYEAGALEFAENEAPARTRAHVRELAAALAGLDLAERYKAAEAERSVSVRPVGDGLAMLQAILPEHLAVAIMDRLTQMGRHQKRHPDHRFPTLPADEAEVDREAAAAEARDRASNAIFENGDDHRDGVAIFGDETFTRDPFAEECDEDLAAYWKRADRMVADGPQIIHIPEDARTIDQIRADLLTDLLLGATPTEAQGTGLGNITANVQVTVNATTLTGTDDLPAQLDNHGPLHPDIARTLAGHATSWTRLFLDPTGFVTRTDTYQPTAGMRRYLQARDQHCRFPGCRMPIHRTETDHTLDWAKGGPTSLNNLAHLCKTHHALKHPDIPDPHRWTARQLPDWTIQWTSPTGTTHTDRPPRRVMFVPSEPEPPADTAPSSADIDWAMPVDTLAPF
jgi:hypothetical protein